MFKLRHSSSASIKLTPGEYTSTVREVVPHPDYDVGHALKITYDLTNEANQRFVFEETFILTGQNSRTIDMEYYLSQHGFESWYDFVGSNEHVVLRKKGGKWKTFLSIVDRSFVLEE